MLLLAIALQSVTAPPAAVTLRASARPAATSLLPDCRSDPSCAADRTSRYRLIDDTALAEDPKQAALRGTWQNCGITGMPVCPKRGRQMFRTSLGN